LATLERPFRAWIGLGVTWGAAPGCGWIAPLGLLKYILIYDAMLKNIVTKFIAVRRSSNTFKSEEKPLRVPEKMCKHKASL
jgi:hypothetical protein